MSHTKVKTTYSIEGVYGSTDQVELYCDHNHSNDFVTFYDENGRSPNMIFGQWEPGNDLWDAMLRLMEPFKANGELKDKVEYYSKGSWEI